MVSNITSFITPAIAWSACSAIPVIEPAIRLILNVGFLISNRCQYYHAKTFFKPAQSFTTEQKYQNFRAIHLLQRKVESFECRNKLLDKILKNQDYHLDNPQPYEGLNLIYGKTGEVHFTNRKNFKILSGTYKKLSTSFSKERELRDPEDKTLIKDLTIPDHFTEEKFHSWNDNFVNKSNKNPDFLNQINEFTIPDYFSKETFDLLIDYLNTSDITTLDQKAVMELHTLAGYLEFEDLELKCILPIFEKILNEGHVELSRDFKNMIGIERYHNELNTLFTEIKKFKNEFEKAALDQKLKALDSEKWNILKNICWDTLTTAWLAVFPLYPTILPHAVSLLLNPATEGFGVMIFYVLFYYTFLTPLFLIDNAETLIPKTAHIISAAAKAVYAIASAIICAPFILARKTAQAIVFTVKKIAQVPFAIHSLAMPLFN